MANEFIIRKGFKSLQDSELTGSLNLSGNIIADGTVEASFASGTSTAISGAFDSVSSSLASELLKNTTDTLTGDLTVTGTITAQEFHTEFVSASITYESGSHKFGDTYDDVHEFTGSINITNSFGGVTGSYTFEAGGLTVSGDDADFNLNITSGSSLADLTEFRFQVDGGTMGRLYMHKGTKHMYLGPTYFPTSSLYLQDGTGTVMSITGSRIGIGTTLPSEKLTVNGNIETLDTIILNNGTVRWQELINSNEYTLRYNGGSWNEYLRVDVDGKVGIGTNNPAYKLDVRSSDYIFYGSTALADTTSVFRLRGNGGSTDLFEVKANGNVGIGSNAPSAKLDVVSTSDVATFRTSGQSLGLKLENTGGYNSILRIVNSNANWWDVQNNDSNNSFSIDYNDSDRFNIDSSGQTRFKSSTDYFIGLVRSGTDEWWIKAYTDGGFALHENGVGDQFTVLAGGNVGIGTTSPIYKLHVNSGTQAARFTAGDGGYAAVTFDGDAGNTIGALTTHNGLVYLGSINSGGTGANGEIRIEPFGGNVMTLDSGGNVGIGNQDPFHKLSVTGDSYFSEQLRVDQPVVSWSDSGTKHYTHLATFSGYGSAASALIINTNIPGHNQSGNGNMFSFRIVGYAYGSSGLIDMMVGCYAGENNYYSAWWTGTCQTNWVDNVYVYTNSSGKVAFQIGETTDPLNAEIAITDFVQGFGNVNTSYADSWSCQAVTTLPTQTQKTTLGYKAVAPDIYEDVTFHDSVGIGTTSITKRLEVLAESNTDGIRIQGNAANASLTIQNNGTGGNAWDISSTGAGHGYGNGNLIFGVTFSPKITFKSDGYILNGGHAANDGVSSTLNGWGLSPNGTATAVCNFSDTNEMVVLNQRDGSGTTQFEFRNGNVERGRIEWTTSATTYNTVSDYRLKENVTNLTGSLAKVNQLEPKTFNFISDPNESKIGFIAHEVQDIVPQAVTGEKDEMRNDGTEKYQGLDNSMLVPLLVGAIKEQQTIIEDLKARIETLEG